MRRTILSVVTLFFVFGLGMVAGGLKLHPVAPTVAVAAPVPAALAVPVPMRCPNIHGAIDGLRSSEQELRDAGHDFCGHKVAAMRAVHDAIEQLRLAEGCDRCR